MTDFGRRYLREYNVLSNFVFADMYKQIIAGTYSTLISAAHPYQMMLYNTTEALNDQLEYELFAKHGARTLELLLLTASNSPILTIYLDDIDNGTIDLYSATTIPNCHKTLPLTVVGTKNHSLKLKATGKHDDSSNYLFRLTWLRIK